MRLEPTYFLTRARLLLDHRVLGDDAARAYLKIELAPQAAKLGRPLVLGINGFRRLTTDALEAVVEETRLMCAAGGLVIMGGSASLESSEELLSVIQSRGEGKQLLVVTQDVDFARAVRELAAGFSAGAVEVARFAEGALHTWPHTDKATHPPKHVGARFQSVGRLIAAEPRSIGAALPPSLGAIVHIEGSGAVRLEKRIGGGVKPTFTRRVQPIGRRKSIRQKSLLIIHSRSWTG